MLHENFTCATDNKAEDVNESDEEQEFIVQGGTTDYGREYEVNMTALFTLKLLLNEDVRDVLVASNAEGYGAFDDVVIRVEYHTKEPELYAIQLKHKLKEGASIKTNDFNKKKGEFILIKYKESYEAILNKLGDESDALLKGISSKNVTLCLFTNAKLVDYKIFPLESSLLSCRLACTSTQDFIDTNSNEFYKFQINTPRAEIPQYFSEVLRDSFHSEISKSVPEIAGNPGCEEIVNFFQTQLKMQFNEGQVSYETGIKSAFDQTKSRYSKETALVKYIEKYFKQLLKTASDTFSGLQFIKNTDYIQFVQERFETNFDDEEHYIRQSNMTLFEHITEEELKSYASKFLKENVRNPSASKDRCKDDLFQNISAHLKTYAQYKFKLRKEREYSSFFRCFLFYDRQVNHKEAVEKIGDLLRISFGEDRPEVVKQFIEFVKAHFEEIVIGETIDDDEIRGTLLNKRMAKLKLLELLSGIVDPKGLDAKYDAVFKDVTNLNVYSQRVAVLEQIKISLQGRSPLSLSHLAERSFLETIPVAFLLRNINEVLHVGINANKKPDFYIRRSFHKILLRRKVLKATIMNIFVFDEALPNYLNLALTVLNKPSVNDLVRFCFSNRNIAIVLDPSDLIATVENIVKHENLSSFNVHHVKVCTPRCLEWRRSWRSAKSLNVFIVKYEDEIEEDETEDDEGDSSEEDDSSDEDDSSEEDECESCEDSCNGEPVLETSKDEFFIVKYEDEIEEDETEDDEGDSSEEDDSSDEDDSSEEDECESCEDSCNGEPVLETSKDELLENEKVDEEEVLDYFTNSLNIVSAIGGMGKTTMLKVLSGYCQPNKLSLILDLKFHERALREETSELRRNPLEYICSHMVSKKDDDFEKRLFQHLLRERRLIIFIDGFDEVSTTHSEVVLSIIEELGKSQAPIWIFTRSIALGYLTKRFPVIPLSMVDLTEEDATYYLWQKLSATAEEVEDVPLTLLKAPLYLSMIAKTFNQLTDLRDLNIAELYERFTKTCFREHVGKLNITASAILKSYELQYFKYHEIAALLAFFPEEYLVDNKIVAKKDLEELVEYFEDCSNNFELVISQVGGIPVFAHWTYAEYFLADWIHKSKDMFRMMYEVLLGQEFEPVRLMFDGICSKGNPLLSAVLENDLEKVHKFCNGSPNSADACRTDVLGRSALHFAFSYLDQSILGYSGNYVSMQIAELLLGVLNSTEIEGRDKLGLDCVGYAERCGITNLIHVAAYWGALGVLKFVLRGNAEYLNRRESNVEWTPLHAAAIKGQVECVRYLTQMGAEINSKDVTDDTPMHFAALEGSTEMLKLLTEKGAKVDEVNLIGWTPLHCASCGDYEESVTFLLEARASINCQDNGGWTPLHVAADSGCPGVIKLLLLRKEGINVDEIDSEQCTALHLASTNGNRNCVKRLLEGGADVNLQNEEDQTPLHCAAKGGHLDVLKLLANRVANINETDASKNRALHLALINGQEECAIYLSKFGALRDLINKEGKKPLHLSAAKEFIHVLEFLIVQNIHERDSKGNTMLYLASREGQTECAVYLVGEGADVNSKNDIGKQTPLHLAAHLNIAELYERFTKTCFREHVGKLNITASAILKSYEHQYFKYHEIAALLAFFPEEYLVDNKIVAKKDLEELVEYFEDCSNNFELVISQVGGIPVFADRTYAEYFLADWIHKSKDKFPMMYEVLLGQEFEPVRLMFDGICSKGNPLLSAVLQNDLETVQKLCEGSPNSADACRTDVLGRSALHFAFSYLDQSILDCSGNHVSMQIAELLLGVLNSTEIEGRDKLGLDCVGYAERCGITNLIHVAAYWGALGVLKFVLRGNAEYLNRRESSVEWTPLHAAAIKSQVECVRYLTQMGAEINSKDVRDDTPMHFAALEGSTEMLKLLTEKGAKVDEVNLIGWTPLHCASCGDYEESVTFLLEARASINCQDKGGWTPLHLAADSGCPGVTKLLLLRKEGINVDEIDSEQCTALHLASTNGNRNCVKRLLEGGADVNLQNEEDQTPLHCAAKGGHLDVLKLLAKRVANINETDASKNTALHLALINGQEVCATYLLKSGALRDLINKEGNKPMHLSAAKGFIRVLKLLRVQDIHERDSKGNTMLHLASREGQTECAVYLVGEGADVNSKNDIGKQTPLHLAAHLGHVNVLKYLAGKVRDIDERDSNGNTALNLASWCKHEESVISLIEAGATGDSRNNHDETPVHLAASGGFVDVLECLEERGADMHAIDSSGNTALHLPPFGITPFRKQCILYLAKAGVDVNVKNKAGEVALHLADSDLIKLLIENHANVNEIDADGNTILHLHLINGWSRDSPTYREVASYLIAAGADVNIINKYGWAPVHMAAHSVYMMELMKHNNADFNLADWVGYTPLHYAIYHRSVESATFLVKAGVDIHARSLDGATPLLMTASWGNLDLLKLLKARKANFKEANSEGYTALHLTAINDHLECTKFLVKEGADVNAKNKNGDIPFDLAFRGEYWKLLRRIEEKL